MKQMRRLLNNKRGISSLFIAIYVTLLAVILVSTIFIGISVSRSSLNSYLKVEQDRMQESILVGYKSLNVNQETSIVESILVNNTGAITARIRSLYVDGKFICDPSKFSGDSYIAPQSSLLIQLTTLDPPLYLDTTTMRGNWTITTERGTKFSEIGANLWLGPPTGVGETNKFYFGPLQLDFNDFYWSNNGGSTWNDGWTIPESASNVIWRIKVTDIDERPLILSSGSSFAMVQNSKQPNKIATWGIGPSNLNPPNLILQTGDPVYLYFSLNGPNSLSYMSTPIPISSNFITIMGQFIESDNTRKDFAQTIPFEAVLVTTTPEIATTTNLNPISSPQTVGTPVTVSGQVSTVNTTLPTVPSGSTIVMQYRLVGSQYWEDIVQPITTSTGGSFSGQLIPPHAGTYEYRAFFQGAKSGQNTWSYSFSQNQTIVVNKASSTTVVTISPVPLGGTASVTANVNPSFATGTVNFEVSVNSGAYSSLGSSSITSGRATYPYADMTEGSTYNFRAHYLGDNDVLPSDSSSVSLHLVTFIQSGLGTDASGTLLTVEGTPQTILPFKEWVCSSGSTTFTYPATISSTVTGKRYALTTVSSASPLSGPTGPITITGTYRTQYLLTVSSSRGSTTGQGWYDADATAYAGVSSQIVAGTSDTQYVFISWGTDASGTNYAQSDPIVMNGPKTALANWQTQYRLTMATNFGTTSPAVGSYWYNAGSVVTISGTAPSLVYSPSEERYVWNGWTGSGTGSYTGSTASPSITMNGPITETASWIHQFYLTVNNGGYGTAGGATWYNAGTNAQATMTPLTVAGPTGTQYAFAGWTGDASGSGSPSNNVLMNSPKTATATWTTQYKITVVSAHGSPNPIAGDHWVNAGSDFSVSVTSPEGDASHQFVVNGPATQSITNVQAAQTLTFTWNEQFYVTVNANGHGSPTQASQWVNAGSDFSVSVTSPEGDASHQFVVNGPATQSITNVQAAQTLTFTWNEQFYITVDNGGHGTPTQVSQWVNRGAAFSTSVTSPADVVPGVSQWITSPTTLSIADVQAAQTLSFVWTEQFF